MFKVPTDEANPTFKHMRKVSFVEWLFSSKAKRKLWSRLLTEAMNNARDEVQSKKPANE